MPKRSKSRRSLKYKMYIQKEAGEQDDFTRGRQQRERDSQEVLRIIRQLGGSEPLSGAQPGRGPPRLSPRRGAVSPGSRQRSFVSPLLLSSPRRRSRSPGRAASPAVAGPRRSRSPRRAASPAVAGPRRRSGSPGRAALPAVAGPRRRSRSPGRAASPAVAGRRSVCQNCVLQFRSKRSKRSRK